MLVVNVGSLEKRSSQPKYKEPKNKKSSYTFYATGETRSITSHITCNSKNVIYIACSAGVLISQNMKSQEQEVKLYLLRYRWNTLHHFTHYL